MQWNPRLLRTLAPVRFAINCVLLICLHNSFANSSQAQQANIADWPQWAGPNRDHKSNETGLLQQWPEGGPEVAWKFSAAGIGYSGCAVVDGKVYSMGSRDGENFAFCLNSSTGEEIWRQRIGDAVPEPEYLQDWGAGPRSTPSVTGDKVITFDDGGVLSCLDRNSGSVRWQVSVVTEYGGRLPKWGYSESPLVDGDRVIICPGGDNFMVALQIEDGKTIWMSTGCNDSAHYVSTVKCAVEGIDMYVSAAQSGLVGFSAENGQLLWSNKSSGNATATIPMPLVRDNLVYHTSAYGTGCVLVSLQRTGEAIAATEVYANKNMQNHHGGVVQIDDMIFGYRRSGGWICQDFLSGEIKWKDRLPGNASASVAYADNRLYVYGESTGTCHLIEPSAERWIEHGKVELPEQTSIARGSGKIWTHPVIADGKLFLRDLDLIYAFDIKAK